MAENCTECGVALGPRDVRYEVPWTYEVCSEECLVKCWADQELAGSQVFQFEKGSVTCVGPSGTVSTCVWTRRHRILKDNTYAA